MLVTFQTVQNHVSKRHTVLTDTLPTCAISLLYHVLFRLSSVNEKNTRPKKRIKQLAVYGRHVIEYSKNAEEMCAWMGIEAAKHGFVSIHFHAHFIFLKGGFFMITAAELQEIRAYNNARNREWWARQSQDERRERRQKYALTQARRKAAQERAEQDDNQTGKRTGRKGGKK